MDITTVESSHLCPVCGHRPDGNKRNGVFWYGTIVEGEPMNVCGSCAVKAWKKYADDNAAGKPNAIRDRMGAGKGSTGGVHWRIGRPAAHAGRSLNRDGFWS